MSAAKSEILSPERLAEVEVFSRTHRTFREVLLVFDALRARNVSAAQAARTAAIVVLGAPPADPETPSSTPTAYVGDEF